MEPTTDQREANFSVGELVLVKYKKKYRLYNLIEKKEADGTERVGATMSSSGHVMRRGTILCVLRRVLNDKRQKSSGKRIIPEDWMNGARPGDPYAIRLEEYLKQRHEEIDDYTKVFMKHYDKEDTRSQRLASR